MGIMCQTFGIGKHEIQASRGICQTVNTFEGKPEVLGTPRGILSEPVSLAGPALNLSLPEKPFERIWIQAMCDRID
jgi:hypothetical protein